MTRSPRSTASQNPEAQIPIRYRSRSGMKPLSPDRRADFLFPAGDAFVDRLEAKLELVFHCRSQEDFSAVVELWAHQANIAPSGDACGAPLLRARSGRGAPGTVQSLSVIKDDWLFSGSGRARFDYARERLHLSLDLDLNPTLWLAFQPRASTDDLRALSPAASLHRRAGGPVDAIPSLDGGENVVDWFERAGTTFDRRGERNAGRLDVYLGHVTALLRERLMPNGADNPHSVIPPDLISAEAPLCLTLGQQAETYWEVASADPVTDVAEIRCAVQAAASRARWAYSTKPLPIRASIERDAPWITLPLTQDINLVIYAKAADRVRFEVRYKKGLPGRGDAIVERLHGTCAGAARLIKRAWEGIRHMLTKRDEVGSFLDLIDLLRQADMQENGRNVISLLANNRSITEDAAPDAVIRALKRLGVLDAPVPMVSRRRNAPPRRYPLAHRWSLMFDAALRRTDCPPPRTN